MISPIPKNLLIHSAELVTKYSPDKWGRSSESSRQTVSHIRIEPSSKMTADNTGTYVRLSAVLFYDCTNSSPGVAFALKNDEADGKTVDIQQVIFKGRIFSVRTIEPFYADSEKIHHYEIGLV